MLVLKKKYLFFFLFVFEFGHTQTKEILILDKITNLPIENVNIYYPESNEGTFTNAEGKASVIIKNADLKISNVIYEDIIIKSNELKDIKTVYLVPSSIQLDEVVINSFDFKKALKYVLDNYSKLYGNESFEKECEFKETLSIDDRLKRLIKTRINWWGKNYKKSNGYKDVKLRLGAIDFNKNEPLDVFTDVPERNIPSRSGYLESKTLINMIYLNTFLNSFLASIGETHCLVEKSESDKIVVSYETDWIISNGVSTRSIGLITFDKESKAIINFENKIELKNKIDIKIVEQNKKEFVNETKSSVNKYLFYKNNENKWSLNFFSIKIDFMLGYENIQHDGTFESSLYVLNENKIEKVNDDGLVDINKPFYLNIPVSTIKKTDNSVLLNEKEKKFLEVVK